MVLPAGTDLADDATLAALADRVIAELFGGAAAAPAQSATVEE